MAMEIDGSILTKGWGKKKNKYKKQAIFKETIILSIRDIKEKQR